MGGKKISLPWADSRSTMCARDKVAEFGGSIVRALWRRVLLTSCSGEKGSAAQRAFAEPAPAVARCCSTSAGRFFALVGAKSGTTRRPTGIEEPPTALS